MVVPTYAAVHNWRGVPNKKEEYKIHIRVTIGPECRYHEIALPLKVHNNQWSGKHLSWVKNTYPYAFEVNNRINDTLNLLAELNKRYYTARKSLTFQLVAAELNKNFNQDIFNEYYEAVCKKPKEDLESATMKRYKSALQALSKFNANIHFHELSESLFTDVKKYLLTDLSLDNSTVRGYFNAYHKVVYWARLDNYITTEHEQSVFGKITLKKGKPSKDFLEEDEVLAWKHANCFGKYSSFERDRDIYMIMIYCGVYYNDFKTLLKTELRRDPQYGYYLSGDRFKNDNRALVPLWVFPDALPLMEKYRSQDPKDPLLFDSKYFMTDQAFNRRIKVIAKDILGWERTVKVKLARFTNTQLFIRYGTNVPIVSKIRGHQVESTTQAYFSVNIREVAEATKNLDFKAILGI